tara:strand:+ start:174 stop:1460 length:1287 start_codon:yes stop_codon:yes gene_type:complete
MLKDMDRLMESGTRRPIKYLEEASTKYPKYRKQILEDVEKLRQSDSLRCHNAVNHKSEKVAEFFCNDCLEGTKGKQYLWCKECNDMIHKKKSLKLHKPILFTTRINLKKDFPEVNLKVLMGQSSGRAGLFSTVLKMMEEYPNKYRKILKPLIETKITETKTVNTLLKKLNEITNVANKRLESIRVLHKDKVDTDFRYYPRINIEHYKKKGKTLNKERYIAGPIDFNLNFSPGEAPLLKNGVHWPLGVYNVEDMDDPLIFDLLFKNFDTNNTFFNRIPTTDTSELRTFKKSLLLYIENVPAKHRENIPMLEDSLVMKDYLNISETAKEPSSPSKSHLNRYNQYLYDNLFYKYKKLTPRVSLSSVISTILDYEGNSKKDGTEKREILFIVNQCRTSRLEEGDYNLAFAYNESMEPRTSTFHGLRRENSNL